MEVVCTSVRLLHRAHRWETKRGDGRVLQALTGRRGVLFHLYEELPLTREVHELITQAHNGVAGHHVVDRALSELWSMNKRWTYMREHVNRFIRQCPCCQKMSYLKVPIHTIPFTIAVYESMERLEVDTIGPLPADEEGHRFKLNVMDCFTRWVRLHPTKDTTSQSCVDELLQHIGTFGTPSQNPNG
jgi:hypothetical protein